MQMMRAPVGDRPPLRFSAGLSRHFVTLDPLMPSDWWAFAFAFALSLSTLTSVTLDGFKGILGFLASTALLVGLYPSITVRSLSRNLILCAYPAWTLLSTAWSTVPERTLHAQILLVPTMLAALTLGGIPKKREVNLGAAMGMFIIIGLSVLMSGNTIFNDTGSGGEAMTGFGSGKNFFGHLCAMSCVMSFSFYAFHRTRFGRLLTLMGLADLAVSMVGLLGSHATGSLLSFLIACAVIAVVVTFSRVPWQMRVLLIASLVGVLIVYVTFGQVIQQMIYDSLLHKFNKDSTLSGRTMLWDYGDRLIADHWLLGYGYSTFWYYTNPDAWVLWRMMGVAPMSGFNFHNTFRETLIDTGLIGLVIYLASFGTRLVRTFFADLVEGTLSAGVRLGFLVYFVVRMPVESTGFGVSTIDAILLLAFLCAPLKPRDKGAAHREPVAASARPKLRTAAFRS